MYSQNYDVPTHLDANPNLLATLKSLAIKIENFDDNISSLNSQREE
jgi:hypothetical protein